MHYLTNTNGDRCVVELLVKGNEEPRIHRRGKEVQHPMILVKDNYDTRKSKIIQRRQDQGKSTHRL